MGVLNQIEIQKEFRAVKKWEISQKIKNGEELSPRERTYWVLFMATDEEVRTYLDNRDREREVIRFLKAVKINNEQVER